LALPERFEFERALKADMAGLEADALKLALSNPLHILRSANLSEGAGKKLEAACMIQICLDVLDRATTPDPKTGESRSFQRAEISIT
jgi:hypothetical protein